MPISKARFDQAFDTASSLLQNGYDEAYVRNRLANQGFEAADIDAILAQFSFSVGGEKKKKNADEYSTKSTYLDMLLLVPIGLFFGLLALFGFLGGSGNFNITCGTIAFTGASLICFYRIGQAIRDGLRPPTAWDKFKFWMRLRPFLSIIGGIIVIVSVFFSTGSPIWTTFSSETLTYTFAATLISWLIFTIFLIIRAPRFYGKGYNSPEVDEAYKRYVGWVEPKEK